MADQDNKPKLTPEMMKNNQQLAAQAALKAQQIMFRKSVGPNEGVSAPQLLSRKVPPEVPTRGDSHLSKQPPEIPPKRPAMKPAARPDELNAASRQPPPLPQKPSSAQSSPSMAAQIREKPKPPIPTPLVLNKFDQLASLRASGNVPGAAPVPSQNPFLVRNSAQPDHHPKAVSGVKNPSQIANVRERMAEASAPNAFVGTAAAKSVSPFDDLDSEDALRGIECGLRNMERAMQEQMIRAAAATIGPQQSNDKVNFNIVDLQRSMGGSATSLDATTQHMSTIEAMRVTLSKQQNIRSMERGFSMDQMRIDSINLSQMRSTLEEMKNGSTRSTDNHMKSLDRNLPLELQYSRHHHHRSQSQLEMVDQVKKNLVNPNAAGASAPRHGTGSLSREDARLRRRSSHDENQSQANAAGNN